jgi:DNA-binding SARP family transcriptional activator
MSHLRFHLFGKFSAQRDALSLKSLDATKEQELLSYLLIHRDRPHPRETLATLLWGDTSTKKSKTYLRQALWHLHASLEENKRAPASVLVVEHDWVRLNLRSDLWLDVAVFERAFTRAQGIPGKLLDSTCAKVLKDAVGLYRGDLLDGWYHDWCLFERERLQNMYLSMLDKLMIYCEACSEYEIGMGYGVTILRYDHARERTHRQLMHLRYMAGDRTGALRQYERCVAALDEELGVKPERRTVALCRQISADRLEAAEPIGDQSGTVAASPPEILGRLKRLQLALAAVQKRIQCDIKAVEMGLKTPKQ